MLNKILNTPVDDLVELVRNNPNSKINFLVSSLKVPIELVEKWLVILEEFKVLKIKYVGFEGFVNLNVDISNETKNIIETLDIDKLKIDFLKKARIKNLPSDKLVDIWKLFLKNYEVEIKKMFFEKAKIKGYNDKKINMAWGKYSQELEVL